LALDNGTSTPVVFTAVKNAILICICIQTMFGVFVLASWNESEWLPPWPAWMAIAVLFSLVLSASSYRLARSGMRPLGGFAISTGWFASLIAAILFTDPSSLSSFTQNRLVAVLMFPLWASMCVGGWGWPPLVGYAVGLAVEKKHILRRAVV